LPDEKEVNPAQPEKVEVSSEAATTGSAEPPATALVQETPAKEPRRRGRGIDLSSLTPEELKLHKRGIGAKSEKSRKDRKKAESYVYSSATEPTKAEAKEILTARGLKNAHVVDLCYDLALVAAEQNGVPANRFLFQNGIRRLLESYQCKAPNVLDLIPDEEVAGELLNRAELYALYDFGFWRHPDTSFDQWLADRLKFRMSAFELSKILGKEDFGTKHQEWTDFAPCWNPLGLRPGYTQKQALTWLDAQSEIKRYLLVASRNSMKSTWARILALTLTVTYPDARILIVSETNRLSKKAMKEFRGYLEMAPSSPTLFQQYFSEFTIAPDEGQSLVYDNPLARLGLPQNSVESSSMESANTGSRFDFCLFDDPISRDNGTANEEQRAAAISKHGSIMKLREPAGYAINIQTPWVQDDLGDVMIQRNSEDPEKPLAVRIDPVIEIRTEAKHKGLLELREEDVVLNFLPKLNWKFVRDEMRSPEGLNFFKTQYMTQWIVEKDEIKCQFDHDELRARAKHFGFFGASPIAQVVMSLDRSWSVSRYADFSCIVVGKIQAVENKQALVISDVKMDRWKESELVRHIVELIEKHRPTVFVSQQDKGWAELSEAIRRQCAMRNIPAPWLRFQVVDNTDRAKARRVKKLELPLSDGRLWFFMSHWTEAALLQLEKFDGVTKSNSHRKDDFCDALSILWESFGPKYLEEIPAEDKDQRDRELEDEAARERRRHFYDRMFSGQAPQRAPQPVAEEQPTQPADPRLRVFGSKGPWRM
jgi:Terminase RNaseH-like domain